MLKANPVILSMAIERYHSIDEQVRSFLYPRLYKLYEDKKLNKGKINERKTAKEAIEISKFSLGGNNITVDIFIWLGGDIFDEESITMSIDEWNNF